MKKLLLCILCCFLFLPLASALEYDVSYGQVRCGQPMTFTLEPA